ncbi:MAG: imidazoleglycerol-phosphate dehydratase [Pseudomonadota bacterium]|jgi:imidazoleglycerol-phosphate dehydratase
MNFAQFKHITSKEKTVIEKQRKTKETDIIVKLNCNETKICTGVGFFDHMLDSFAKHSQINMEITCKGDLHIDAHHSVEDVGIVLGMAFCELLYPANNIERFGSARVVMDEALIECDLDISARAFLVCELGELNGKVGEFDVELAEEFFRAFTLNAKLSTHIAKVRGQNKHHIIEGAFKAYAVAIRRALTINTKAGTPSTKGVI